MILSYSDICEDDINIYLLDLWGRYICVLNKNSCTISDMITLCDSDLYRETFNIEVTNDYLVVFFRRGIEIYEIKSHICVRKFDYQFEKSAVFSSMCRYENKVYIFFHNITGYGKFDLSNWKYNYFKVDNDMIVRCNKFIKITYENTIVFDNKIWRVITGTNILLSISVINGEIKVYQIDDNISFYILSTDGEYIYITSTYLNELYVFDKNLNMSKYKLNCNYHGSDREFRDVICVDNKYIILSGREKSIWIFDKSFNYVDSLMLDINSNDNCLLFRKHFFMNGKVVFVPHESSSFCYYDLMTHSLEIDDKFTLYMLKYISRFCLNYIDLMEIEKKDLFAFIQQISYIFEEKDKDKLQANYTGKLIYDKLI